MTTIATLVVPPPTSPTAQTVPALVQPPEEFGRQQQEQLRARPSQSERPVRDPRRTPDPTIAKRGRPQLESDTNEQNRAKVIPFPGAQADTESLDDALASPSSVFVAQVLGQQSEPRASTNAFERGIAAYEATTSRTDAFIGSTPPVELRT